MKFSCQTPFKGVYCSTILSAGLYLCTWQFCGNACCPEAGISKNKNYYATNSGSPEVELRFCPYMVHTVLLKC